MPLQIIKDLGDDLLHDAIVKILSKFHLSKN